MKKCEKKRLKLNNAGMTLIEILVAIAIMAVALVPLLYSFVSVAKNNARAREIQQTTTLAHTVMENCKAYSMDEIDTQLTGGTFLTGVTATQTYHDITNDIYYMTGVTAENGTYDIALKFSEHPFSSGASTTVDIINTKSINPYMDAVFTPMGSEFHVDYGGGVTADYKAAEIDQVAYLEALKAISDAVYTKAETSLGAGKGVHLSESEIENNLNASGNGLKLSRSIVIFMWNPGAGGSDPFEVVDVYYRYAWTTGDGEYHYDYIKDDGSSDTLDVAVSGNLEYETRIYSNSLTKTNGTKLESVFFFYYPAYTGSLSVFPFEKDEIMVSTDLADGTRTFDVYLIKQKNPAYSEANMSTLETSYTTKVTGNYVGASSTGINIYHNFDTNIGGGGSTPYNASTWFTSNLTVMPKLVPTENKTLMYDVELKIYDAGAYDMANHVLDATKQPVLTMEGTTLDW